MTGDGKRLGMRSAAALLLTAVATLALSATDTTVPALRLNRTVDGAWELLIVEGGNDGSSQTRLGLSEAVDVRQTGAGVVKGALHWLTWREDGENFYTTRSDTDEC